MKLSECIGWAQKGLVAPRRGAWIETGDNKYDYLDVLVAPRRGAWIETIALGDTPIHWQLGRTPQGCVD